MSVRETAISGLLVCLVQLVQSESSPFTTVGWPACYISKSYNQHVGDLYTRCYGSFLSYPGRNYDISYFYSFCSPDHECCLHYSYPACCKTRHGFSDWELAGLVIGCVMFVAVILGVAFYMSKKLCTKDETD